MKPFRAALALAPLLAALATGGCQCTSFPFDVEAFRCETTAECTGGRVCDEGFCVVEGSDAGGGTDAGADSGPSPDSGTDSGPPVGCTSDMQCAMLTTDCATGVCNLATGFCQLSNEPDGTACDDGLFCNDGEACAGGVCTGGAPHDCSATADDCNSASCDETADLCVPAPVADGTLCDDALFCTLGDGCTAGACGGLPNGCDDTNDCTMDACDETANACVNDPSPLNGSPCDDALFCTAGDACAAGACTPAGPLACDDGLFCSGPESCDETMDACVSSPVTCTGDGFSCSVEACVEALVGCDTTLDELLCGAGEVCNPVAYPGGGTGCGAAPTALLVACPATELPGGMAACTISLSAGGSGVPGEAARLACVAEPRAVTLFADDFTGGLDPAWTAASGTPATSSLVAGDEAAAAINASWAADVGVGVAGLSVLCVDFAVAQANAIAGDRIRWQVAFDAGAFSTIFDLDFGTWELDDTINLFNRNVCAAVPGGALSATLRLMLDGPGNDVFVDDVAVSGLGAPFTNPPGGGPDGFTSLAGWTTIVGGPTVGTFGGSSVLYAESGSYTIERTVDASACDVLDVDFDFGKHNPNAGETVTMNASVDGAGFAAVETVDLNPGAWNVNSVWLPWLGLRRLTDQFPAAAGSASVDLRFVMTATGGGRQVWADNFEARCVDLPDPTVSAVSDAGAGSYAVLVSAPMPEDVLLVCTWATANDGPLTGSDTTAFVP